MLADGVASSMFISTFCTPQTFDTAFRNILGGFTPCFCDVVLLGVPRPSFLISDKVTTVAYGSRLLS